MHVDLASKDGGRSGASSTSVPRWSNAARAMVLPGRWCETRRATNSASV